MRHARDREPRRSARRRLPQRARRRPARARRPVPDRGAAQREAPDHGVAVSHALGVRDRGGPARDPARARAARRADADLRRAAAAALRGGRLCDAPRLSRRGRARRRARARRFLSSRVDAIAAHAARARGRLQLGERRRDLSQRARARRGRRRADTPLRRPALPPLDPRLDGRALRVPFARAATAPRRWPRSRARASRTSRSRPAPARRRSRASGRRRGASRSGSAARASGLSDAVLAGVERRVAIPMAPGADSLNVATACGIALHHYRALARASVEAPA